MRLALLLLLLFAILLAGFVLLNWPAFNATAPLSLGLITVEAPLGLIMLALLILLAGPALLYVFYLQRSWLIKAGRDAEELRRLHELAERAEASRFTELRELLTAETQKLEEQNFQLRAEIRADLERLAQRLGDTRDLEGISWPAADQPATDANPPESDDQAATTTTTREVKE